jgi:hypothetical protein
MIGSRRWMEMDPCDDLNPDGQSDDPVDGGAEWRPPPGPGYILAALLPSVLDSVGCEPQCGSHAGPVTPAAATTTNAIATPHSTAITIDLPSATAKPI